MYGVSRTTIALITTTTTTTAAIAARVRRRERYSARPVDTGAGGHRTTGSRSGCRRLGGPRPARRALRRRARRSTVGATQRAGGRAGGGGGDDATVAVASSAARGRGTWCNGRAHILITEPAVVEGTP